MKNLLTKLKLIDSLSIILEMSQIEFVARLRNITSDANPNMFASGFDPLASSKEEYRGKVNDDSFHIRRRRRFFENSYRFTSARGFISEINGQVLIDTEISGPNTWIMILFILFLLIYIFMIGVFMSSSSFDFESLAIIPFIIIHALIMIGLPYFIFRNAVRRMKYDLEREFFFLTKNNERCRMT